MRVDSLAGEIDTALVVLDASLRAAPNNDGAILGAVQAGSTGILTGASIDGTGGWLPANAVAGSSVPTSTASRIAAHLPPSPRSSIRWRC